MLSPFTAPPRMSYLSRHEIEDLRPELDRMVYKVLGSSDSSIRNIVENCLYSGFDRKRIAEKLSDVLDSKKTGRLCDRLDTVLEDYRVNAKSRKRPHVEEERKEKEYKKPRPAKKESREPEALTTTQSNPLVSLVNSSTTESTLSSNQIQQMMLNAQREIEERKRALSAIKAKDGSAIPPLIPPSTDFNKLALPVQLATQKLRPSATPEEMERAKKIADLQAQIRAKLSGINSQTVGILPPQTQEKPKPLILDDEGRTVDKTGRTISIPTLAPTLKANIRAKKKEIFNKASQPADRAFEDDTQRFVDDRIVAKPAMRNKRALRFHEPGKFQQMAERMRMKAQLEKLQNEISQIARKTGISSATKLALIAPKQDSHADDVPQMEWWDSVILSNDMSTMDGDRMAIRESAVTNLIEHPTQIKPPSEYFLQCFFICNIHLWPDNSNIVDIYLSNIILFKFVFFFLNSMLLSAHIDMVLDKVFTYLASL